MMDEEASVVSSLKGRTVAIFSRSWRKPSFSMVTLSYCFSMSSIRALILLQTSMFMTLSFGVVPPTTSPSTGENGMSNYTSTRLQASQNLAADPVAVPIITLTPALCLPIGPGLPPPSHTSATISKMAEPVSTPIPLQAKMQPVRMKCNPLWPGLLQTIPLQREPPLVVYKLWQFLPNPPLSTSLSSAPTPIDIRESYLHDQPNQPFVHYLLDSFSPQLSNWLFGSLGRTGILPIFPLLRKPFNHDKNMLNEVSLGHTAGPFFPPPPFPNFQGCLIGTIPKNHSSKWRTIFHLSYQKHHPTIANAHLPPEDYSLQYIKVVRTA